MKIEDINKNSYNSRMAWMEWDCWCNPPRGQLVWDVWWVFKDIHNFWPNGSILKIHHKHKNQRISLGKWTKKITQKCSSLHDCLRCFIMKNFEHRKLKEKYYVALKKKEILPFASTGMSPEDIMLSEIKWNKQKDKYCMILLTWAI